MKSFAKKRTIISIIITIIVLCAVSKYWLIVKPFHIGFDIKGKGSCKIEVVINKKNNHDFDKTRSEDININLNENSHADFYIIIKYFIIFTGEFYEKDIIIHSFIINVVEYFNSDFC